MDGSQTERVRACVCVCVCVCVCGLCSLRGCEEHGVWSESVAGLLWGHCCTQIQNPQGLFRSERVLLDCTQSIYNPHRTLERLLHVVL